MAGQASISVRHSKGLIWWNAVLAALTYLASAAALVDFLPPVWLAVYLASVGALSQATSAYLAGTRTLGTVLYDPPEAGPRAPLR